MYTNESKEWHFWGGWNFRMDCVEGGAFFFEWLSSDRLWVNEETNNTERKCGHLVGVCVLYIKLMFTINIHW